MKESQRERILIVVTLRILSSWLSDSLTLFKKN